MRRLVSSVAVVDTRASSRAERESYALGEEESAGRAAVLVQLPDRQLPTGASWVNRG
jgi:hypothetical protein